jgi:hypothetical protein
MKHRMMIWPGVAVMLLSLAGAALAAESLVSVKFTPDGWDPAAWTLCKNPTVEYLGKWIQRDDCIENVTPTDPAKKSALDQTLTTMIYNTKFSGNWTATATFEIGAGSAPGIMLVQDWAPDAQGRPQYGEFYEVIIYEKGLNLWHHFAGEDGKRTYEKTSYSTFALQPDTHYTLQVRRQKQSLQMTVDGHIVGVLLKPLPDELFIGVEGCEGVSRVYDFAVER